MRCYPSTADDTVVARLVCVFFSIRGVCVSIYQYKGCVCVYLPTYGVGVKYTETWLALESILVLVS